MLGKKRKKEGGRDTNSLCPSGEGGTISKGVRRKERGKRFILLFRLAVGYTGEGEEGKRPFFLTGGKEETSILRNSERERALYLHGVGRRTEGAVSSSLSREGGRTFFPSREQRRFNSREDGRGQI